MTLVGRFAGPPSSVFRHVLIAGIQPPVWAQPAAAISRGPNSKLIIHIPAAMDQDFLSLQAQRLQPPLMSVVCTSKSSGLTKAQHVIQPCISDQKTVG